ncbi:MAG: CRISPR-associated protein Csx20 [Cytophagales bacterium]|nr:CRISPR-associated protein Csx20 [Bernardetiaceae bacterium]MDW8211051.1 CRISPR-associated protein Csx20 [Cytophagales bacterium]
MATLYLVFSHKITPEQQLEAEASLGISHIEKLPEDLQTLFSNVPPELESLQEYLQPLKNWLAERVQPQDFVLIQGDFGVTFSLVSFCFKNNLGIPIYSTTQRESVEVPQPDGSVVMQKVFRHKRFRRYEP